jgi:hypothetical protein
VGIIGIADDYRSSVAIKATGIMVSMKRYWISLALLMPMRAVSVGEISECLHSKSTLVHLSQSSTGWSGGASMQGRILAFLLIVKCKI